MIQESWGFPTTFLGWGQRSLELVVANQPTPAKRTPLRNKGWIRPYWGKPMVPKPSIRALFLWGGLCWGGGWQKHKAGHGFKRNFLQKISCLTRFVKHKYSRILELMSAAKISIAMLAISIVQKKKAWLIASNMTPTQNRSSMFMAKFYMYIHIYTAEVQPPFLIGWFPNHHYFSRVFYHHPKRNQHFQNGEWLPG